MGEPWLSILTILGTSISAAGLFFTIMTLRTAKQIRNRMKDKKIIDQYRKELSKLKTLLDNTAMSIPSDFRERVEEIAMPSIEYVRRNKKNKIKNKLINISSTNRELASLVIGELLIELEDEGV